MAKKRGFPASHLRALRESQAAERAETRRRAAAKRKRVERKIPPRKRKKFGVSYSTLDPSSILALQIDNVATLGHEVSVRLSTFEYDSASPGYALPVALRADYISKREIAKLPRKLRSQYWHTYRITLEDAVEKSDFVAIFEAMRRPMARWYRRRTYLQVKATVSRRPGFEWRSVSDKGLTGTEKFGLAFSQLPAKLRETRLQATGYLAEAIAFEVRALAPASWRP